MTASAVSYTHLDVYKRQEPLDKAVFSEVMFDKDTSGEVPEHRDLSLIHI